MWNHVLHFLSPNHVHEFKLKAVLETQEHAIKHFQVYDF